MLGLGKTLAVRTFVRQILGVHQQAEEAGDTGDNERLLKQALEFQDQLARIMPL